jgi:hypothetical protein
VIAVTGRRSYGTKAAPCATCGVAVEVHEIGGSFVVRCDNDRCPDLRGAHGDTLTSAVHRWNCAEPGELARMVRREVEVA